MTRVMTRSCSSMVKGIGIGLFLGMVTGFTAKHMMKKESAAKKTVNKVMKSINSFIDNIKP